MKLFVELNDIKDLKYYKGSNIIGVIVGLNNISLKNEKLSLDDFNNLINNKGDLKIIVDCERLFSDEDLDKNIQFINSILKDIDYLTFSDFGLYENIIDKTKLIYRAPTYLTNTADVKTYMKLFNLVVISSEISKNELLVIDNNIDSNHIIDIFGMNQIFYSRRPLITNYFKYRMMDNDPYKDSYLVREDTRSDKNHIKEDETGTHIYESFYYKLDEELIKLKADYGFIHVPFMKSCDIRKVIKAYNEFYNDFDVTKLNDKLKNIKTYKGAYDIESVLRKGDNNE